MLVFQKNLDIYEDNDIIIGLIWCKFCDRIDTWIHKQCFCYILVYGELEVFGQSDLELTTILK